MSKLFKSDEFNILKKTQDNLELTQENNKLLASLLTDFLSRKETIKKNIPKSDEEKLRAAYALNLCTVSISQIIDYNDIRLLESEYDAILNNLNLEKMPKDEALLKILKHLLDVITFFRIQEGDKRMMEKEYTQRMKDAIWAAIPNPSIIAVSGNPVSIAIALASQVGIGYMNYRKEKAKIGLDKERKEWELQRSAIEQFNGLRRELFDTAWRLADEYQFPDKYRITEHQISQFNEILMDTDDLRRYERLEYIQENFEAYPPFWYYIGNAANLVSQSEEYEETLRGEYKNRAIGHFSKFLQITEQNILREDQLTASCALEQFELIENKGEKVKLLDRAIKSSGNAFDVAQICAISYLEIGDYQKSCELLRMLVNENYNETLNAQLLSKLYVSQIINGNSSYKDEYITLKSRVLKPEYLFPIPHFTSDENLDKKFLAEQKNNLLLKYANGLRSYVKQCENRYENICNLDGNIISEMAEFIKDIATSVEELLDNNQATNFLDRVKFKLDSNKNFEKMLSSEDERKRGTDSVKFKEIFDKAFFLLAVNIRESLNSLFDMGSISAADSHFTDFLLRRKIDSDNYDLIEKYDNSNNFNSIEEVFGDTFKTNIEISRRIKKYIRNLQENKYSKEKLVLNNKKVDFFYRGDAKFKPYLGENHKKYEGWTSDNVIFAILNDRQFTDTDLIFTTSSVYATSKSKIRDRAFYKDIKIDSSGKNLKIGDYTYSNDNVELHELYKMICLLAELSQDLYNDNGGSNLSEVVRNIILKKTEN